MPYICIKQSPRYRQLSFEDILLGEVDVTNLMMPNISNTRTYFTNKKLNEKILQQYDFNEMINLLEAFNNKYKHIREEVSRESLYCSFKIPKKSGGLRNIDAPNDELKEALYELKRIFENDFCLLYHTSAFAYTKGRSTISAVKKHTQNNSKWYAKLDFSDFFGSTTPDFLMRMMSQIFPVSEIVKMPKGKEELWKALNLCFLNGGLPQGTPISPFLTNVMMIPIDHKISNDLKKEPNTFVYTRYADDIIISSKRDFDIKELEIYILDVLNKFGAPFILNTKKTRYGSSSGRNWNLGVMVNKDNQITIGHKKKKQFKAMINNYIVDKKNQINWSLSDVQHLNGVLSYYLMIENECINHIIKEYNCKYNVDFKELLTKDLKQLV